MKSRFSRSSGILLHPTSLPGRFGVGDLGDAARRFVTVLADGGQSYWQVLPLGPTGYGDSPYQCFSAFAGNRYLISPESLARSGLLTEEDLKESPTFSAERVDYGPVIEFKNLLLSKAFQRFKESPGQHLDELISFCAAAESWLDD